MARVLVAPCCREDLCVGVVRAEQQPLLPAGYVVVLREWDLVVVNELRQEPDLPVHLLVARGVEKVGHARADRGLEDLGGEYR